MQASHPPTSFGVRQQQATRSSYINNNNRGAVAPTRGRGRGRAPRVARIYDEESDGYDSGYGTEEVLAAPRLSAHHAEYVLQNQSNNRNQRNVHSETDVAEAASALTTFLGPNHSSSLPNARPNGPSALRGAMNEQNGHAIEDEDSVVQDEIVAPGTPGTTQVVVLKWDKAWLCVIPEIAKLFIPNLDLGAHRRNGQLHVNSNGTESSAESPAASTTNSATDAAQQSATTSADNDANTTDVTETMGDLVIDEEDGEEKAKDASNPTQSTDAQPMSDTNGAQDAANDDGLDLTQCQILWNNREGICRLMTLQTLLDGWKRSPPRYAFLSQRNENGLFNNLFSHIFPDQRDKLSMLNIVGAVDSFSQSSRAMEQRLLLMHRINVPPTVLEHLVRITRADIKQRQQQRQQMLQQQHAARHAAHHAERNAALAAQQAEQHSFRNQRQAFNQSMPAPVPKQRAAAQYTTQRQAGYAHQQHQPMPPPRPKPQGAAAPKRKRISSFALASDPDGFAMAQ